ncbi:class I SAM-dependent methyltransferase [bacterium]|nr:class I SAM-dependent methyltransferase [bacterium]
MNEKNMWDERFKDEGFVYGTKPNGFLESVAGKFKPGGRLLSLGAGEGRNEVWLAERGFQVTAVDSSQVGLDKLQRLAAERGVQVETIFANALDYIPQAGAYDAAILIFLHVGSQLRPKLHDSLWSALRPGGFLAMEQFRREQIERESGGPRNIDMLYHSEEIPRDFPHADILIHQVLERDLDEGALHLGAACLLQVLARKPD